MPGQNANFGQNENDNPDWTIFLEEEAPVQKQNDSAVRSRHGMKNDFKTGEVVDEIYEEEPRETPQLKNKANESDSESSRPA